MRRDWRDEAACRGLDPTPFFPVGEKGLGADQKAAAKQVCESCPVTPACLTWAVDVGIPDGVFGGLDGRERRALKSRRRGIRTRADPAEFRSD